MTDVEIARQRLYNQHIAVQHFKTPAQIVQYMGAIQAQDYAGAKWAIGLRLVKSSDKAVDKAMAAGMIIRTHVLRPTWHFVVPEDLRWMLDLTARRIIAMSAARERQLKLDGAIFKRSNDIMAKALSGGKQLSRPEMMALLQQNGIGTNEQRSVHLLMRAELDKVICSGARQGKQFSYALFDDRIPQGTLQHDEALAQLVRRYFISRGPATAHDFAWWSGLTLGDAKTGLEIIKDELISITVDNQIYWRAKEQPLATRKAPSAYLLPAYDEFAVAYSSRAATVNPKYTAQARYVIFDPSIVVNNQVVGTWGRMVKKDDVDVTLNAFGDLTLKQLNALLAVENKYRRFLQG
ncbi:MAG TPA: winged helix DNA-binding domain-containing protein [Mucilaginibacter sp.]